MSPRSGSLWAGIATWDEGKGKYKAAWSQIRLPLGRDCYSHLLPLYDFCPFLASMRGVDHF